MVTFRGNGQSLISLLLAVKVVCASDTVVQTEKFGNPCFKMEWMWQPMRSVCSSAGPSRTLLQRSVYWRNCNTVRGYFCSIRRIAFQQRINIRIINHHRQ